MRALTRIARAASAAVRSSRRANVSRNDAANVSGNGRPPLSATLLARAKISYCTYSACACGVVSWREVRSARPSARLAAASRYLPVRIWSRKRLSRKRARVVSR